MSEAKNSLPLLVLVNEVALFAGFIEKEIVAGV